MARSSARNRWIACGSCLFAVGLVVALSLTPLLLSTNERLTHIGHRIASSSSWVQDYDGYYWDTNDSQIIALKSRQTQAIRLDDRARTTTPTNSLNSLPGVGGTLNQGPRPSPDGKWLLYRPFRTGIYTAVDTTTRKVVTWKANRNASSYVLWLGDSRRWVEFGRAASGRATQPVIHSVDGPDRKTALFPDIISWPVGVGLPAHVLDARSSRETELWEYDLDAAAPKPVKHRIALPTGAVAREVEGSPDGKWVAYLAVESQLPLPARIFGDRWPFSHDPQSTVSLWVSRTDGSELRHLGFETRGSAAGVQWAPDGKRLSLFLNNGFYIVPVN